jgi:hypothetical protein
MLPPTPCSKIEESKVLENHSPSPVYLIERPGVSETAVPHLVDHFYRMHVVFAVWPAFD